MGYEVRVFEDKVDFTMWSQRPGRGRSEIKPDMDVFAASAASMFDAFQSGRYPTSVLLPPAVRYVDQANIIMEKPPCRMTIALNPAVKKKVKEKDTLYFNLNIPWTVYIIYVDGMSDTISKVKCYFRQYPLQSLDNKVSLAALPNVYDSAEICLPDDVRGFVPDIDDPMSLASLMHAAYALTWHSGFNSDLMTAFNDVEFNSLFKVQSQHREKTQKALANTNVDLRGWNISMDQLRKIISMFYAWEDLSMQEVLDIDWSKWFSTWQLSKQLYPESAMRTPQSLIRTIWSLAAAAKTRN